MNSSINVMNQDLLQNFLMLLNQANQIQELNFFTGFMTFAVSAFFFYQGKVYVDQQQNRSKGYCTSGIYEAACLYVPTNSCHTCSLFLLGKFHRYHEPTFLKLPNICHFQFTGQLGKIQKCVCQTNTMELQHGMWPCMHVLPTVAKLVTTCLHP